ncbi:MAG: hypothetical protein ACK5Z5_04230 [Neisseriaceae bacterium]
MNKTLNKSMILISIFSIGSISSAYADQVLGTDNFINNTGHNVVGKTTTYYANTCSKSTTTLYNNVQSQSVSILPGEKVKVTTSVDSSCNITHTFENGGL